jgi:hypothetical protein
MRIADDERILSWDVWNEPDNLNTGCYAAREAHNKIELVTDLLGRASAWARNVGPVQPLTSGLWHGGDWSCAEELGPVQTIQLVQSDIISFHDYGWPEGFERRIGQLSSYDRPMSCTEFLARGAGSSFGTQPPTQFGDQPRFVDPGLIQRHLWGGRAPRAHPAFAQA